VIIIGRRRGGNREKEQRTIDLVSYDCRERRGREVVGGNKRIYSFIRSNVASLLAAGELRTIQSLFVCRN
jgi:hypothetical protein